jgi:hypothetical protein
MMLLTDEETMANSLPPNARHFLPSGDMAHARAEVGEVVPAGRNIAKLAYFVPASERTITARLT